MTWFESVSNWLKLKTDCPNTKPIIYCNGILLNLGAFCNIFKVRRSTLPSLSLLHTETSTAEDNIGNVILPDSVRGCEVSVTLCEEYQIFIVLFFYIPDSGTKGEEVLDCVTDTLHFVSKFFEKNKKSS